MWRFVLFQLLAVLSVACSENRYESGDYEKIRLSKNFQSELLLSELVEIDSVLAVSDNTEGRLGEVNRIWKQDEGLIVHSTVPSSISVLAADGSITAQIHPDFRVSEITSVGLWDNKIYILDRAARKVHQFNKKLEWLAEFSIPVFAQSFKMLSNSRIVLYTGNEVTEYNRGKVVIYDLFEKKVVNDLFPISDKQRRYFHFLTTNHFPQSTQEIFFWDSALNELYRIEQDNIRPAYQIDYGAWGLPDNFYETADFDNAYDFVTRVRKQHYAFRHFNIIVNDQYILIHFEKSGDFLTTLFSRASGQSLTFSHLRDDVFYTESINQVKLHFFVGLEEKANFIAFMPSELIQTVQGTSPWLPESIVDRDVVIFGRLKMPAPD